MFRQLERYERRVEVDALKREIGILRRWIARKKARKEHSNG
jgi:hypothetical protein